MYPRVQERDVRRKNSMTTSKTQGHTHKYEVGDKRTSINDGHSHRIKVGKEITEPSADGHTHKL